MSGLKRPAEWRKSGMPRWVVVCLAVNSYMAASFWYAAVMLASIAATSPSQPCCLAS